jgi:anti-sigma regulatory factor (Ser/Thr protein kinase)
LNSAETQTARLHDALGYADMRPFEALSERAPFPHSGDGSGDGPGIALRLDVGSSAAAEARAAVGLLEGRADAEALDDVRLLLSELVTNSVRHSGAPAGATIGLRVCVLRNGGLRAEVTDGGRGFEPTPRDLPQTEAGGWGLHLVDRLADRWGVDRRGPARVWFEIDAAE